MPTFPKREHLCLKRHIDGLFAPGSHSLSVYPLRATYRLLPLADVGTQAEPPVKVLLSVAKRRLHHAVDRNRAKRQLREAYRLQKDEQLLPFVPSGYQLHIAFIWLSSQPVDSQKVSQRMRTILRAVAGKLPSKATPTDAPTD